MKCKDIIKKIEEWAPHEIAWDRDNAGVQVGTIEREVKNILLSLDLTDLVIDKALQHNCNLIITHHPLLFNPLKKLDTTKDKKSILIEKLIKNDITLYTAHTNLDYTRDGVSFELAARIGLNNIRFLSPIKAGQSKLVIFVPSDAADKVAEAAFSNGGGIIGGYSECSFRTAGTGTFRSNENANPAIGSRGNFETVEEVRLEVIADNWKLKKIIKAALEAHPYEEPAYDIYPLGNANKNYGAGAVGELDEALQAEVFLRYLSEHLNVRNFRYSGLNENKIRTVAVCGGSGSEYINDAVAAGAEAFVTADVKYHTFQEAEDKILLIDAGHYETEIFSLEAVEKYISKNFKELNVFRFSEDANPVKFYNNQGAK